MRHGLLDAVSLQRTLYDALDQSDDIVLILEQTGDDAEHLVIASANGAFCRATGYDHAELTGRLLSSLTPPDTEASHFAEIVDAVRERRSLQSELQCVRKNGELFWFGLHLMPAPSTATPCFVVLGRDITESLLARQQQAAVQGLLAKVFLCVKAPVAIVTDTGIIQMTNPALDELLGYPPGGLIGRLSAECTTPDVRAAALAARRQQSKDGRDYTLTTRLLRADGSSIPVEITSIMVHRDDLKRFRIITVLRQPVEAPPPVSFHLAGKIRLIGLEDVKEALGSRWPAVAARAMASAEHVIRRRCGPHDTHTRTADGGFLICFSDATEDEAAFRAAAIARKIRTKLLGEGESEATASVSAVAAVVDVPNLPGQTADTLTAIINDRLNSRLAQIEAKARETLRDAVQVTACRLEPVRSRRSHEIVAYFAKLPYELEQRILSAYSTLPMNERQNFDFDRLVLGVAAEQVITEIAAGGSHLVLVNVDFEVFLERRRTERYIAACQALDSRLRERLVLMLYGMPRGFPKSRVLECVMRLRPFCHGVGFESDNVEAPAVELSLLGAAIVVLRPTARDMDKLADLVNRLHAHQARVLVRHVASWADAKPLARIGVDLISMVPDERDTGRDG